MRKWKKPTAIALSVIAIILCVFEPAALCLATGDKGCLWWYLLFAPLAFLNYDQLCKFIEVSKEITVMRDEFKSNIKKLKDGTFIFGDDGLIGIANKFRISGEDIGDICHVDVRQLHLKRRMRDLPYEFLIINKTADRYIVVHNCAVARVYRDVDGDIIDFDAIGEVFEKGRLK